MPNNDRFYVMIKQRSSQFGIKEGKFVINSTHTDYQAAHYHRDFLNKQYRGSRTPVIVIKKGKETDKGPKIYGMQFNEEGVEV